MVKVLHSKPEGYVMKSAAEQFETGLDTHSSSEPLECEIKVSLQPLKINIDQVEKRREREVSGERVI